MKKPPKKKPVIDPDWSAIVPTVSASAICELFDRFFNSRYQALPTSDGMFEAEERYPHYVPRHQRPWYGAPDRDWFTSEERSTR